MALQVMAFDHGRVMKAHVQLFPFGDGGEALAPMNFPFASAEFDLEDFLLTIGSLVKDYIPGDDGHVVGGSHAPSKLGGDVEDYQTASVSVAQGGIAAGYDRPFSYGILDFHAWTGDDIKPSFGRVDPPTGIADLGEVRYARGDFQYEYRFLIPFVLVSTGTHQFTFATGDSGTFQDASIGYEVDIQVEPAPRSPTIEDRYRQLGAGHSFLGTPAVQERSCPDGIGRYRHYEGGSLYWCAGRGAHEVHGGIRDKWFSLGAEGGLLSYPISDQSPTPDGLGWFNHFQGGSIYWTPSTGAHEVHGGNRERWAAMGRERSYLGYPITDEEPLGDGSRINNFQGGSIRWTAETGSLDSHVVIATIGNEADSQALVS
jgi:hypothetical protein